MRVVLAALFSERYPSAGESHGISAIGGQLVADLGATLESLDLLDMVAAGRDASDDLLQIVREKQPNIIAISVTYGTYDLLKKLVPALQSVAPAASLVLGGVLATYLDEDLLTEIAPLATVVVGEGETPFSQLVLALRDKTDRARIPNLAFRRDGTGPVVRTQRINLNEKKLAPPYRAHLTSFIPQGIQLFAEATRSCSWSKCTFCKRGLLDVDGRGSEYRAFPGHRIGADLRKLVELGASSVTFADEDFLGEKIEHARWVLKTLQASGASGSLTFDASMTVHSVFAKKMSDSERVERLQILKDLHTLGLRKVFLGVESGSPSQLKRYAKGHSASEAAHAIAALRSLGVEVELGWIMFDPLCTLKEVEENIRFLLDNRAAEATSYVFNELRLQKDTKYVNLLKLHEVRSGRSLLDPILDRNTLSYSYRYLHAAIDVLMSTIKRWTGKLRPLHYPLKNMTRFGTSAALDHGVVEARQILGEMRVRLCELLLEGIQDLKGASTVSSDTEKHFELFISASRSRVAEWHNRLPARTQQVGIVKALHQGTEAGETA